MDVGQVLAVMTPFLLLVLTAVGAWAVWEIKRLHARIDSEGDVIHNRISRHVDEMDEHIKESVEIHKAITRLDTTLSIHTSNGGSHDKGGGSEK